MVMFKGSPRDYAITHGFKVAGIENEMWHVDEPRCDSPRTGDGGCNSSCSHFCLRILHRPIPPRHDSTTAKK